jgi:hypothetical protein
MAGEICCQLVGNLELGIDGCIVSVNTSSSTEVVMACGEDPREGPTTGTLSISAYADTTLWVGCPSRAGVNIPFIRKYDCDEDVVYFIFSGQGQSFFTGEADRYVSLYKTLPTSSEAVSASSMSGPTSIYMKTKQTNGYGMAYAGNPISFETSAEGTEIKVGGIFGETSYYLQSFNFEAQPGQLPIVTYSLVYSVQGD